MPHHLSIAALLLLCTVLPAAQWGKGDHRWPVKSDDGHLVLTIPQGTIRLDVRWKSAAPWLAPKLAESIKLLPKADQPTTWTMIHCPELGVLLGNDEVLVGVGRTAAALPVEDGSRNLLRNFHRQRKELIKALPGSSISQLAKDGLKDLLERLDPKHPPVGPEEADPAFIRHLIAAGWLAELVPELAQAKALTTATKRALRIHVLASWTGVDEQVQLVGNAFGARGHVLRRKGAVTLVRPAPRPFYLTPPQRAGLAYAQVTTELTATTKPLEGLQLSDITKAQMTVGSTVIASWQDDRLDSDTKTWRKHVTIPQPSATRDYIPPHLVLRDLDDGVLLIATRAGSLQPSNGNDAERFIADAAKACPTAADMDLIGQYLFRYVFDSPDNRYPMLIGSDELKSDIHQTAEQSLATSAGGICRGDCDDLSELYQRICEAQGRIAHVIMVPGHAALAFAEKDGDTWAVELLQTGPALRFPGATLPEALEKTYRHFSATTAFDPNGIGLLLRFSGENRRSAWRLSWRIFEDADYAKTMIDVQRDWHYQTYSRAIQKMERLIADGDDDNANYRELGGLYGFTGQYAEAAVWLEKAIAKTPEPSSKFQVELERFGYLKRAEDEGAEALARRLIEKDFPQVAASLGTGALEMAFTLPRLLIGLEDLPAARTLFKKLAWPRLAPATLQVIQLARRNPPAQQWNSGQARQFRMIAARMAGMSFALIKDEEQEAITADDDMKQFRNLMHAWWQHVAFRDVSDADGIMGRYAGLTGIYQDLIGEEKFIKQIEAAKPPKKNHDKHTQRQSLGGKQMARDLSWASISLGYWYNRLQQARQDEEATAQTFKDLFAKAKAAHDQTKKLGMLGPVGESLWHNIRLITALYTEDEKLLRERMRHVVDLDDKALRDGCAGLLGSSAQHCSPAWWDTVLDCWADEIDYKAKYFWIAWLAAINDAPAAGLATARLAVERFPKETAFKEELVYLEKLYAEQ